MLFRLAVLAMFLLAFSAVIEKAISRVNRELSQISAPAHEEED